MKIIIEGAGRTGSHLAKMLAVDDNDITVIDANAAHIRELASQADVATIIGEPSNIHTLREAGCAGADLFIAVNPSMHQSVNITSALLAKKLGAKRVVARIGNQAYLSPENKLLFKDMGLDMMFFPEKSASDEIVDLLRTSGATDTLDFARGKLQLSVFKLDDDSPLLDMDVKEFVHTVKGLQPDADFRIVALSRGGKTIIPRYDTTFKFHDYLYIISHRQGMPILMAEKLVAHKLDDIKIIDIDPDHCRKLSEDLPDEVEVVCGDVRNSDFLQEQDLRGYQAVLAFTGNDEVNILTCVTAKKMGVPRVIAQVENLEYMRLAEELGVDTVINKKLITASRIYKFTLSDKVRSVRYVSGTDAEVLEYTAAPGSRITRGNLKEIDFPADALIGGVIRGSESFIAVGHSHIEPYDRVAVFALPDAVKDVDKMFK